MTEYIIIEVDGPMRWPISAVTGKADPYTTPRKWKTRKEAEEWIRRRTYKGMSFRYEIKEATDVLL